MPRILLALPLLIASCSAGVATSDPAQTPTVVVEAPSSDLYTAPADVPAVDTSKHSVPLEEVYFDTFNPVNRAVPLSLASQEMILRLRDAIPPIHNPIYESASEAVWLTDNDVVLGYTSGGQAWAFPIRILNFHEIVNDEFAGEPVLISYCPLCYSGIVFSRRVGDRELYFGNTSALYESDMVMLDYETGSYWWQVAGEAIVGTLTGEKLTTLPSLTTTWAEWRSLYPETRVLSRNTGHTVNYSRDPFADYAGFVDSGRFAFPVSEAGLDARLTPGTKVLAVRIGDEVRAYPLSGEARSAIRDTVAGEEIIVLLDPGQATGAAFEAGPPGEELTLEVVDGEYFDPLTGSRWDLAGRAQGGDLDGSTLTPLPVRISFWFAIVAAEPGITVYPSD